MSAHLEQPVGPLPLRRVPVRDFADAFTRRLLLHRGMTTELLEHHIRCPLRVQVRTQTLSPSRTGDPRSSLPPHPAPAPPWLVRRTELVTPEGTVVSRNVVTGRLPRNGELVNAVTGRLLPLGRAVAATGVAHRRNRLTSGLSDWPGPRGALPAVTRGYLLHMDGESPLHVEETFNPAVVSTGQRSGSAHAGEQRLLGTTP
ncbi:hypothetical protein ABZ354_00755 [Streptomyces sp. NPDC005925]|uniref:hypothetical protein n=1 Tax=Streptomyces sp. NPDC005925 TaxID=3157172 RepID=UPI0033F0B918